MAKAKPGCRVVVQLDPRMVLEAIILNRRERLPASRRQEWLRGLLVQGFRSECQALRGAREDTERRPAMRFVHRVAGGSPQSASRTAKPPVAQVRAHDAKGSAKPFAALGKVIG